MRLSSVSRSQLYIQVFNVRRLFLSSVVNMCQDKGRDKKNSGSRPATPTDDDCCGNSCNPCVYDVHKNLLEKWERRKLNGIRANPEKNVLNPLSYKPFEITEIMAVADEFIKIRLDYRKQNDGDSALFMNPSQHVILSVNGLSRAYTPISWCNSSMELVIKVHSNGAFSPDSKRPRIGEEIQVRGPYGDFLYERNSFRQIVAFCIGSGIAAIYPVAKAIVDDEDEETRIHIVAGFRSLAQIPLTKELRQLADYWNVDCTLQLSSSAENGAAALSWTEIRRGCRLNENTVAQLLDNYSVEKTLILICGTPEFSKSVECWSISVSNSCTVTLYILSLFTRSTIVLFYNFLNDALRKSELYTEIFAVWRNIALS